jgi:hypothetical protein
MKAGAHAPTRADVTSENYERPERKDGAAIKTALSGGANDTKAATKRAGTGEATTRKARKARETGKTRPGKA